MKKLALVTALCLVLLLAGCGSGGDVIPIVPALGGNCQWYDENGNPIPGDCGGFWCSLICGDTP